MVFVLYVTSFIQVAFAHSPNFAPDGLWTDYKLLALTPDGVWACHSACAQQLDVATQLDPDVLRLSRFQVMGPDVVLEALYADGNGYFTTSTRTYCYTQLPYGYTTAPTQCTTNLWPNYAWPVCQVNEFGLCATGLMVPYDSSQSVKRCGWSGYQLTGCQLDSPSQSFTYQGSVPRPGSGLVSQSGAEGWTVFSTSGQVHLILNVFDHMPSLFSTATIFSLLFFKT